MILYDGHLHTLFCPHGTKDPLEAYCERALELGLKGITFTEHAPLPSSFIDPVPNQDSAMAKADLYPYLNEVKRVKKKYKSLLSIKVGLEVDFIEGYEEETKFFLNEVGPELDDSILSVHFLKHQNEYICIDYSPEHFERMVRSLGTVELVHDHYYETIKKSIITDLGRYKPKRIGHITLTQKFKQKFQAQTYPLSEKVSELFPLIKEEKMSLDLNGAGTLKPLCQETYPPLPIIEIAFKEGIPLVYGSDAHQVKAMMAGKEVIPTTMLST
ncbi:histidinol-phosphatase HisJ [Alkalihalobacillus trypoxylicola]|uniref:Histidinol-phosphatase n=1 Tax=Alkalihalobacillus trypoxylicola TaxID=519424 RepID=A0A162EAI8_9BACI|nr:histidinol-phosphatase HisJ [Alkalihalobacillus trypoxylicola]KYG32159.1 histidinol phosphatase [Alkalihalobacillus trypoxylicola]